MNKILVELYLPAINKSVDMYIPYTARLGDVEPLIISALKEVVGLQVSDEYPIVICNRFTGAMLDINRLVCDLGLQNGSKLMLI